VSATEAPETVFNSKTVFAPLVSGVEEGVKSEVYSAAPFVIRTLLMFPLNMLLRRLTFIPTNNGDVVV
jgi:hypothetical protein